MPFRSVKLAIEYFPQYRQLILQALQEPKSVTNDFIRAENNQVKQGRI
jgi:hypothetical protein